MLYLQLLSDYFGPDDASLNPADAFLKSYLANKAWKQPINGSSGSRKRLQDFDDSSSSDDEPEGAAAAVGDDEDEEFLEQVDRFEAAYNFRWVRACCEIHSCALHEHGRPSAQCLPPCSCMLVRVRRLLCSCTDTILVVACHMRVWSTLHPHQHCRCRCYRHLCCCALVLCGVRYEEPGAAKIQSFPRVIADSVRRKDDRRKRTRDAKAARAAEQQEAREAELRRLKNLKKDEIQDM